MTTQKTLQKLTAIMLSVVLLMEIPAFSVFAEGDDALGTSGTSLGSSGKIITAFDPLAEEIRFQRGKTANLPEKVSGIVDNLSTEILVTWSTETNAFRPGLHVYTAKPADGKLPTLKNIGGQDGETRLYLQQKSADNLTVTVASATYTGSPIEPIVTVKFGTETLISSTDYTVAYANNINAGTATVTGVGNYNGTKTATFTITKATPTLSLTASTINFGETLTSSTISDNSSTLGTWVWADSTIVPPAGTTNYNADFTPTDSVNYESVTQGIAVTVNPIVPTAPTNVTATAGDGQASVSVAPPVDNGGSVITGYKITSSDGQTAIGTASPIIVKGLTNGTSYTFTAIATNSVGDNPASAVSNPVIPKQDVVNIAVTGVIISPKTVGLIVGKTAQLTATVEPSNATIKDISWSSSNSAIATVDGFDNVTAVAMGSATVTAKNDYSKLSDSCAVTVTFGGGFVNRPTVDETASFTVKAENSIGSATQALTISVEPKEPIVVDSETPTVTSENPINLDLNGVETGYITVSLGSSNLPSDVKAGQANVTDNSYDKTVTVNVTDSTTIEPTSHIITATAGMGGSISPIGNVTVNNGKNQTFAMIPSANHVLSGVTVDGENVAALASYTFSNVTADHSINAVFSYVTQAAVAVVVVVVVVAHLATAPPQFHPPKVRQNHLK